LTVLKESKVFKIKGKDISHVSRKSRTINTFMSRAKIALWFMKSFGLELKGITLMKSFGLELKEITAMKQNTGIIHSLHADNCNSHFDSLSNENKEKIEQVLFLLD
jgi:hypothetical protein